MKQSNPVSVRVGEQVFPTYLPAASDKNPMFLEKRVYQGSSGRVYPLPCTDRISEKPVDRAWQAVWLENEFLRVLVLPEIGGRIHAILDKTNGYDLIYNQPVIKPALVGLAGPWASGGIEFNWPQHHRPATYLPVEFEVEQHADGSCAVWCSDHDPMCRMKGMHGVCLHPGRSVVELKVRAYNRTPFVQTFLWWANVATRVHEAYQSFFPPDVSYVADHARRSMSEYPLAQGHYYGVDYGARKAESGKRKAETGIGTAVPNYEPNDLSFYANIPVPTSYMCMGSREDFFGGYDYKAQAGLVHLANHHISPGKKQWTWGNHEFGYAWDRNLTDADAAGEFSPYIEIMAGVYTDNQPDFSFLQPGETKTWSQYWYPIRSIGPAQHANLEAAVSLKTAEGIIQTGVSVTQAYPGANITLRIQGKAAFSVRADLSPGAPFTRSMRRTRLVAEKDLQLVVTAADGREIIAYQPRPRVPAAVPPPATEPPPPAEMASADELYVTGLHLDQYRHATRCPTLYWREALRRDPLDARCNNALGLWHLRRGEWAEAEAGFRKSIERLTRRNANPYDGEPYYNLGLCLRYRGREDEAYDAFYKAVWNQAWQSAGYHALAELDCLKGRWGVALDHLERALRLNTDNLRARNLKVLVLRRLGQDAAAGRCLNDTLTLDPLDAWARHLAGREWKSESQVALDLAHDFARAGFYAEAAELLEKTDARHPASGEAGGTRPLLHYTLGWLEEKMGRRKSALNWFADAAALPPDYCFPARLEEIGILELAMARNPRDGRAPYYLGNLLYDRRRHAEAIRLWEQSACLSPRFSIVWRNLGIGYFNVLQQPAKARTAYDRALKENPGDARLLFERDQLWKRLGEKPARRLRELEIRLDLVQLRDDLSVELSALYNQTGQPEKALAWVSARRFQPWEGGEGGPLGQHVRSHLALGQRALESGDAAAAVRHFEAALTVPRHLGEARHLLANQSDIHYWLGQALDLAGESGRAREEWLAAARFKGDFQNMSVRAFSEMTYYSALAAGRLGEKAESQKLFRELLAYGRELQSSGARIDYFATSLPTMLLFEDDLQYRQITAALFLQAQARLGLGQKATAKKLLAEVLARDPNHALAADLKEG